DDGRFGQSTGPGLWRSLFVAEERAALAEGEGTNEDAKDDGANSDSHLEMVATFERLDGGLEVLVARHGFPGPAIALLEDEQPFVPWVGELHNGLGEV